eukprot:713965-Rhodomonas_salina.1
MRLLQPAHSRQRNEQSRKKELTWRHRARPEPTQNCGCFQQPLAQLAELLLRPSLDACGFVELSAAAKQSHKPRRHHCFFTHHMHRRWYPCMTGKMRCQNGRKRTGARRKAREGSFRSKRRRRKGLRISKTGAQSVTL